MNYILFPQSLWDVYSVFSSIFECEKVMWRVAVCALCSERYVQKRSPALSLAFGPEVKEQCDRSVSLATAATTILAAVFGEHANVPDSVIWGCTRGFIYKITFSPQHSMRLQLYSHFRDEIFGPQENRSLKVATEVQTQTFLTLLLSQ